MEPRSRFGVHEDTILLQRMAMDATCDPQVAVPMTTSLVLLIAIAVAQEIQIIMLWFRTKKVHRELR